MKHLAVVIPLSGDILTQTLKCWDMLSQKFHIEHLSSNSVCPHITISSGDCVDKEKFKHAVYSCLPQCVPINMRTNGLGVFVKKEPVIYIRWFLSRELFDMCKVLKKSLRDVWVKTSESSLDELWLPKSTLALKDTSYDQLSLVLNELNLYNFEQSMAVDKLTLLEIENKEIVIEEISIN